MGASAIPLIVVTVIWAVVGGVLPWFIPKGPNKGITQTCLIITACACWLFWLCCYMMQMNPLIGPILHNGTLLIMKREWGAGWY